MFSNSTVHQVNYADLDLRLNRNKLKKRVLAFSKELPPPNEQFVLDFEKIRGQFLVSMRDFIHFLHLGAIISHDIHRVLLMFFFD